MFGRAFADKLDDFTIAVMQKRHVPGLSMAIIEDGKILRAQGYGLADTNSRAPVTMDTLFQAGSISKPVTALGALHLVERGQLSLDIDVNTFLTTWKIPTNALTTSEKVTLRRILSHSAGLTVHGFPGYAVNVRRPTLVQVLDGAAPANTPAVRVDLAPGQKFRYSGGGYTVLQQMILDVISEPFPRFMHTTVLEPLGMSRSSFEQPLDSERAAAAATGYYADGKAVPGKWHIYPEMAAAGLWTTASDLARFAIGIQQAFNGTQNRVISQATARQMLAPQIENVGLGLFLEGKGKTLRFRHGGRDEGFDCEMLAFAETGQGAVVMINANDDSGAIARVLEAIARQYRWPQAP
jgi:CubicO group peptidase (beta-lactamase class C family)